MSPSLVCPLFCMSTLLAQRCSKTRRKLLCQIQNIFNQPAMFPAHQNWYLRTSNMLQVVKAISLSWVVQECNLVAWEIAVSVTRDHIEPNHTFKTSLVSFLLVMRASYGMLLLDAFYFLSFSSCLVTCLSGPEHLYLNFNDKKKKSSCEL